MNVKEVLGIVNRNGSTGVTEDTLGTLFAAGFDSLEKLCGASLEDLAAVCGIGKSTAAAVFEGLTETASREIPSLAGERLAALALWH